MLELAGGAETVDVGLGGARCDAELLGDGEIGLAIELGGEAVEKAGHIDIGTMGSGVGLGGWEIAEDVGGVLKKHTSHDERGAEVGVGTEGDRSDGDAIHEAERGENHGQTEGDEAKTTDGGDDIQTEERGILELDIAKELVELELLWSGERETDGLGLLERLIEREETVAEMLEILIDSVVGGGEDVEPFEDKTFVVEDEAAEETVFGIGDERENLTWSAGEQSREARTGKLDKFTVFATCI